ncbi:MAG: hypothetical protein SFX73_02055 [Kofleriaceae bacterium]|nr:hypothetical protein [Kofleriaceae bacterium]
MRADLAWIVLVGVPACGPNEPSPAPNLASSECARSCEAAGACLLAPTHCVVRCEQEPEVRACITTAGDCAGRATCLLKQLCRTQVPRGTGTCLGALTCARSCAEIDCVCRCAEAAHPRHTLVLARAGQCVVNCDFDETCAKARCMALLQACALQ